VEKRDLSRARPESPSGKGVNDSFPSSASLGHRAGTARISDRIFPLPLEVSQHLLHAGEESGSGSRGCTFTNNRRECISAWSSRASTVPEVAKLSLHRNPTLLLKTYTALRAEDLHLGPAAKRAHSV